MGAALQESQKFSLWEARYKYCNPSHMSSVAAALRTHFKDMPAEGIVSACTTFKR